MKGSYIVNCYQVLLNANSKKENWASLVRNLLQRLGFGEAWMNQGVGNITVFLYSVKQRLTDNFIQSWRADLENSSRARTYTSFKLNFGLSTYLINVHDCKHRKALTRLIASSHRLLIETGRWNKPKTPHHLRICQICNADVVQR